MREFLRRTVTPLGLLDAAVIFSVIAVTVWSLHPSLLFSSSLLTGGDTGSHLALPAYLRTQGNIFNLTPWYPGWFAGMPAYTYYFVLPDVLATLASYVIGFAVAFKLATVLGSVLMPITAYCLGRLLKAPRPVPAALAAATLPFLFDASYTIDGGNLFSTMAGEYAFSLSLALSLLTIGLFARGVRTGRGYWWAALGLSATLAAHILPWIFTIGAVGVLVVFELLHRRGIGERGARRAAGDFARPLRFALGAGLLSVALSAWWLFSFLTSQNLTNSMGYTNDNVSSLHAVFTTLGWYTSTGAPAGDRWVIVLAALAFVVAFLVRDRLGMILATLTALSLAAFVFDPQGVIWNERLVPFWFITIHLSVGWLFGYPISRWVAGSERRRRGVHLFIENGEVGYEVTEPGLGEDVASPSFVRDLDASGLQVDDVDDGGDVVERGGKRFERAVRATVLVGLLGLFSTVPGLTPAVASALGLATGGNQVSSWAQWNYSGYQGKPAWPEYHDLMTTMAKVSSQYGCGRAMWEYNSSENRFGTPMALMLLPYWTNNCVDSMEGLFFETSPTTPYHFLDQAELSASPSNPQVGLPYGQLNVTLGVQHLQMLGVKYYIAFSPTVIAQANADPSLQYLTSTKTWPAPGVTWRIYLVKNSDMVQPLTNLPNVVQGIGARTAWLAANTSWWLNPAMWNVVASDQGPSSWPHVSSISAMKTSPVTTPVTVSNVVVNTQSLSFHVSQVGTPVLVKISYYPRWHAVGATGPYRVSPNLMVVVPTSKDVSLVYGSTPLLTLGNIVSDIATLAGLVTLWFWLKRRRIARR